MNGDQWINGRPERGIMINNFNKIKNMDFLKGTKMNADEFLKSLDKVYCRLQTSKHGVGVFAIKKIPMGTNPFEGCYDGEFIEIPEEKVLALEPNIKSYVIDMCPFEDGHYLVPEDGMQIIDISFYINHSKEPNMKEDEGGLNFFAARDIETGEELTVDYETYNSFSENDPIYQGE